MEIPEEAKLHPHRSTAIVLAQAHVFALWTICIHLGLRITLDPKAEIREA
jgi:hypothetical protein